MDSKTIGFIQGVSTQIVNQEISKVNQTITSITSGIKSITQQNGNQLVFTLNDDSQIVLNVTGLSSNDYTTLEKSKLASLDESILNKFTYVSGELLFNGQSISETIDLTQYLKIIDADNKYELKDSSIVKDSSYVHTDNNYTNLDEAKLTSIPNPTDIATKTYVDNQDNLKADKAHSHLISDVTGLQTSLDSKVDKVANKSLVDDSQISKLEAITGTNTGDENLASIKSKLGQASTLQDGYLTSVDWNTFNNKQNKIFIQSTQPPIATDNIWIDNSTNPNSLRVCDGTSYVQVGNSSSGVVQEIVIQNIQPSDTTVKLWLDTSSSPILNWYNGTSWMSVGSSSGHVIQSSSQTYPSRKNLKFTGGITVTDDSANDTTVIDVTSSSSGGFLNVKGLGMTIVDGGNEASISFTNPASDNIDKIYLYVSYLEDLSNQSYEYVSANATLLNNSFVTTNGAINIFNLPINDNNLNKNAYIKVFVGYGGTDYSSGSSINQVLADVTPTSPVNSITITQLAKDSVKLTWNNPSESDLKSVNVVMKYDTTLNSIYDGTLVYTGNGNTCTVTGLSVGKHAYFRIYTLDISNNIQSDENQVISIQLDNTPPSEATNFSILSGFSLCKLKFSDSISTDWKISKVVRKVGSEPTSIDDGTLILTNMTRDAYKNNYFIDGGLSNGTSYYYKVYSIDNFGNISEGISQVGNPVATSLPEVTNFKIENIQNGTKQKISWTNPFAPSGLTYIEHQLFYTKDQTVSLDTMTRDQCIASGLISSLNLGVGTGQGVNDSFTTSTTLTFGDISRYKIFIHFDSSGTAVWSSGTYDIKEVKDETPCLDYTNISFVGYDGMIRLKYTDPVDTDWNQTVIILSKNGYINDENSISNDIIQKVISTTRNEYSTNSLQFNSLTNGTQYYISLFSYDTSNNVNRNITNRATVTPNTIVVNNPTNFTATSNPQGTQINLSWTNTTGNYTSRELYGSTTDITGFTKEQCQSGGYLLNNGVGTGSGNSDTFIHTGAIYNTTYYYKIFTKYTYNSIDYYSTGIGNNAKLIDTQAPLDLVSFTAIPKNGEIDLAWNFNSNDTDIQKIVIVRNSTNNPINESDGTIIVNSYITSYQDMGLNNDVRYYYRAFIYDIHGNINNNDIGNNKVNTTPSNVKEYGINWNKSTDVITRLGNAIGLNAPVINGNVSYANDFSSLYPWNGMKRCNLSDTGVINAFYGDVNYKTNGTNGQCMVQIPKFYYKVVNIDTNNIQFWIADAPKTGYDLHPAFFRCRDKLCNDQTGVATAVDYRYHHTYLPYYNSTTGKLESKSGVTPSTSISLTNGRTYSTRGNGWSLVDFNLRYAIQLLYLIEFASFDSQSKIGNGFVDATNTSSHVTGGTNSYGNNSYGETTGKYQMSYRGIEDFYGNLFQWIDGFYCDTNRNIMIGNKGFNDNGSGYTTYTTSLGTNINGYISDIFGDKITGFIPKACIGSNTSGLYDQGFLYSNSVLYGGGRYDYGSNAGVFCSLISSVASFSHFALATSLSY